MLKIVSGTDTIAIQKAIAPIVDSSVKDGSYRRHVGDTTLAMIDPYFSESLFGETYVVVFDGLSMFPESTRTFLVAQLGVMMDSGNQFILIDEKFSKEFKDEAKKQKVVIEEFSQKEKITGPSAFAFTDAYLLKDKKTAWLLLTKLFRDGSAPEEVHGALFWAIKSLYLAISGSLGRNAEELGMKPYPYDKSKRFGTKWTKQEASEALFAMTTMLEATRKKGGDLGIALERLVLL